MINKLVYDLLVSNPTLSDGTALFHADHGNLIASGSGAAPSVTTLEECANSMGAQTNSASELLNVRPNIIIGPHSMAATLSVLRSAVNPTDPDDPSTGRLITATDSRLSGTAWYCVGNPQIHPAITVVVLQGTENRPRLEELTKTPGGRDGRAWRVGYDACAVIADHKALLRNDGA